MIKYLAFGLGLPEGTFYSGIVKTSASNFVVFGVSGQPSGEEPQVRFSKNDEHPPVVIIPTRCRGFKKGFEFD